MIRSKKDLKEYISLDNKYFTPHGFKNRIVARFTKDPSLLLSRYLLFLRKEEYYINTANGNKLKGALGIWFDRRKNILGNYLGIDIGPNCIEKGCELYHPLIIVNYNASIGENCKFHGNNCVGNNGITKAAPRIGNNVDIGYGAVIIGDVTIADDVVIGANAVITKSIIEPGSVVAGVPGRIIKSKG